MDVRKYWLDYLFSCKNQTNQEQARRSIEWLYKISNLKSPTVIFVDSPLMTQFMLHFLASSDFANAPDAFDSVTTLVCNKMWAQLKYINRGEQTMQEASRVALQMHDLINQEVRHQIYNKISSQMHFQIRQNKAKHYIDRIDFFGQYVLKDDFDKACDQMANSYQNDGFSEPAPTVGINDYGIMAFWDMAVHIGRIEQNSFSMIKAFFNTGVYEVILLKDFCIISNMPVTLQRDELSRLHCATGPAVRFRDSYEQYYWHGVAVPSAWILNPMAIEKPTFYDSTNIEQRRCLMEILGQDRYFDMLLGDTILKHSDIDEAGNQISLYRTKKKLSVTGDHIQYLKVVCPSTKREYLLCPPNQKSKNVWEAKASTFHNEKIQIRHGDVGLLNINKEFVKPEIET